MKRIKSAQYMRMPNPMPSPMPKPFPSESISNDLDPQYDIEKCKGCDNPKYADDLTQGYCQDCLESGTIKQCSNCDDYIDEDESTETNDGPMCSSCAESLYGDRGQYVGPRRDYYSGPAEWY